MIAAVGTEWLKLRRSRIWWLTTLAFTLVGAFAALIMYIGLNPDRARALGLVGAKSQLVGIRADWTGLLGLLAQIAAVGGILVFGIILIWIFGREYSDHTVKDLLALPVTRSAIVAAKFIVAGLWCLILTGYLLMLGLAAGLLLRLPGWSTAVAGTGIGRMAAAAIMTIMLCSVLAFAASLGRGYLAPIAVLFVTVFCAQIAAAAGYGAYFPFSVPAIVAGIAGPDQEPVSPIGYISVAAVTTTAVTATIAWWRTADQPG